MIIALWIIAICELIRIIQNTIQLLALHSEKAARDRIYSELHDGVEQLNEGECKCGQCRFMGVPLYEEPCCKCGAVKNYCYFEPKFEPREE